MTTRRLLAFYGDDFTGSSAVMEVLQFAGVSTVMFLEPPSADDLARFPDVDVLGIAGVARSRDPEWMRTHLPEVFESLGRFGAPVVHYKVCSTFDSSPTHGSIGTAIDVGAAIVGGDWHPLIVGAPAIGRYQAFGNLFARLGDEIHRLDRHPVMRQHPATPMHEADVREHLGDQTARTLGLVDLADLKSGLADAALTRELARGAEIVAIDVVDDATLEIGGRLVWNGGDGPVLAVGSQGVEYALVAHWRATGHIPDDVPTPTFDPVDQLFAVSGSCSSVTAAQIDHAEAAGFLVIELDPSSAVREDDWLDALESTRRAIFDAWTTGRDVLVATSRGPGDPSSQRLADALADAGEPPMAVNDRLGRGLGTLVADLTRAFGLSRAVVAGGDTSGHAITALRAKALSALAPLTPGAPLCVVHADDPAIDGLQVCLKGGQMGTADLFTLAKLGLQHQPRSTGEPILTT